MCDTVFTLQPLLYRHFDQHIENQKVSVFKCPDCSLLYAQKQLMMDHIKVCGHPFLFGYQTIISNSKAELANDMEGTKSKC